MLRDITIGQHFPGDSLVHKFDPRMKLVLTIVYIILLFAASNPLGLTLSLVFLVAMYGVAKIPFKPIYELLCNEYLHVRYKAGTVLGTAEITVNKTVLVNASWR